MWVLVKYNCVRVVVCKTTRWVRKVFGIVVEKKGRPLPMCEAVPDRVYFLSKKGKRILKIGRKVYERGIYLVKFCIHSFPLSVLPRSRSRWSGYTCIHRYDICNQRIHQALFHALYAFGYHQKCFLLPLSPYNRIIPYGTMAMLNRMPLSLLRDHAKK